jgi:hypothetical protein
MIGSFDDGMQFAEPLTGPDPVRYQVVATVYFGASQRQEVGMWTCDLAVARQKLAEAAEKPCPERFAHLGFKPYDGLYIEVIESNGDRHPLIEESERVEEVQESGEETGQASVVTKFYKSREVDVVESVRETIKASDGLLSAHRVFEALSAVDASVSLDSVRRAFKIFSNPMVPSKSMYLCDEVESGVYQRRQ